LSDASEKYGTAAVDVIYAEAAIINAVAAPGASIPQPELKREIDALQRAWESLDQAPGWALGDRFYAIAPAWQLRSLAHGRNDAVAQKAVDDLLGSWKSENRPKAIELWLEEALTTFGPPPIRPRIIGPGAPGAPGTPSTPKD